MIILAIDPGVRADLRRRVPTDPRVCACALGDGERLRSVYFARPDEPWGGGPRVRPDLVIVERPEYQGARSDAAQTGDLIALAWSGAQAAYSVGAPVEEYTPGEWKHSEAKPPQHLRLWEDCLTEAERNLFPAGTYDRIVKAATAYALHPKPGKSGAEYYGRGKGSDVHNLLDAGAFLLAYVGRFR